MNFQSLKSLIDNLIQTYTCPSCQGGVDEENIEVVGTAGSSLNVEVNCPECARHTLIRAQMVSLEIPTENITPEKLSELQSKVAQINESKLQIGKVQQALLAEKSGYSIKDEEIIQLNKTLKQKHINVESFFSASQDK